MSEEDHGPTPEAGPNDPHLQRLEDGSMMAHLVAPLTPAKLRRAAFILDFAANSMEESECPFAGPPEEIEQEDPAYASAAVLDDVRAVMLGRGRDHGYRNEIVNLVTMRGGTMGVSVSHHEERPTVIAIAFGATGQRSDMRERLGQPPNSQVPPLSYVEITDFDREGAGYLLAAIKLAYPNMLEQPAKE